MRGLALFALLALSPAALAQESERVILCAWELDAHTLGQWPDQYAEPGSWSTTYENIVAAHRAVLSEVADRDSIQRPPWPTTEVPADYPLLPPIDPEVALQTALGGRDAQHRTCWTWQRRHPPIIWTQQIRGPAPGGHCRVSEVWQASQVGHDGIERVWYAARPVLDPTSRLQLAVYGERAGVPCPRLHPGGPPPMPVQAGVYRHQ